MFRRTAAITFVILFSLVYFGCAGNRVTADKKKAQALEDLGMSFVRQGNLRAGLEKLLEAVKLDPENADIHHELALVYRNLGEYQLSLDHFKRTLALRPEFSEAWNNKGTVYLALGKWDMAIP